MEPNESPENNEEPLVLTEEEEAALNEEAWGTGPEDAAEDERRWNPPLHVVVIGSTGWDEPVVVQAALLAWAQHHPDRDVVVWTTGAPDGAEAEAREFAQRNGWATPTASSSDILEGRVEEPTVSLAFVLPGTEADEFATEYSHRRPVRRFTVESLMPNTRWLRW